MTKFLLAIAGLAFANAFAANGELGPAPRSSYVVPSFEEKAAGPRAGQLDRASVIALYHTLFLPAETVASGWSGNVSSCDGGSTSDAFKQAVIDRANFYRALAGLPWNLPVLPNPQSVEDQSAALMMSANNSLNHTPPTNWTCYTSSGADAAGHSNIALGLAGVDAVDAYMDDYGSGNIEAGHRRWILYPPQIGFGTGDITGAPHLSNALWIAGNNWAFGARPSTPNGVAWPPLGYVPWDVLPAVSNRWSFSYPNAGFSQSTAAVVSPAGSTYSNVYDTVENGYGDNTLVFEPQGFSYAVPPYDTTHDVTIGNITGAPQSSYTYSVTVIDAEQLQAGFVGDFDGDGKSDLVWRNMRTGETVIWLMNGLAPSSAAVIFADPQWMVVAVADLDGDGKSDIVWRNYVTGQTAVWLMDGLGVKARAIVYGDPNWYVTRTGDFNGDGKADLVWRNSVTGQTAIWLMNGVNTLASAMILADPAWSVTHVADLDGNGKSDLVWRNSASGQIAIWLMDGLGATTSAVVYGDPDWFVTHAADFDHDGRADLVLRNRSTGQIAIWRMLGTTIAGAAIVYGDVNWSVVSTGDFDGDGKADLVVRNATTGQTAIWLMNGLAIASRAIVFAGTDWQPAKIGNFNGDLGTVGPKHDILWRNSHAGIGAIWLMNGLTPSSSAAVMSGAQWWAAP